MASKPAAALLATDMRAKQVSSPPPYTATGGLSAGSGIRQARRILEQVADPEIPVLTIADLGILRALRWRHDRLQVIITPTYSGCPAMQTIADDIRAALNRNGYTRVEVITQLAPPWTTDWLSAAGRKKLLQYGIVPPAGSTSKQSLRVPVTGLACPRCQSANTEEISRFGSTPCKALYRCNACLEPFDYFKCL
ncbi:MAG: phenylacetate-CoA oxygenase subunit PaaJ [Gammaproteobacteria bacterium]|nr:phenylacetate-CoA oxygenase subunit PaaJ [Gammaproteobacteria bacterium]MCY4211610.1 phenylacetate-CoA oxygenase subunit PaaJ [Gammaproteobacteria bacterium]MCY4282409.1 phenylacetate-CoA oxygenase subunit PaaJ [Gammaproteobacteria bacterium]MCY4338808.1 phenylacetate-CoA oxygenase subunit PaaJ [Gammaproteobacteria bacterium]